MELPEWVERAMKPLRDLGNIPTLDYNRVCNAVMRLGEVEGARLAESIANIRARAATVRRERP